MISKINSQHAQKQNFLIKNLKANQFAKSPKRESTDNLGGIKRANNSPSLRNDISQTKKSRDNSPS